MVDYSKAKVYKLVKKGGDELGDMYVGSTCQRFCERLGNHRWAARSGKQAVVQQWIRDVGPDNVQIVWIADIPCESFEQQRAKEQEYIELLKPSLNMNKAYVSREERMAYNRCYYLANREKQLAREMDKRRAAGAKPRVEYTEEERVAARKATHAAYRERNKEKVAERRKSWRERNREHTRQYTREYYQQHQDHCRKYAREHYQQHRERCVENARLYREKKKASTIEA